MKKIRLYHVGQAEITRPDIAVGRKNADLGPGFYTSDSRDFVMMWAAPQNGRPPVLNEYELDADGLNSVTLPRGEAWLKCVIDNRNGRGDVYADRDTVTGPIANDTLFETLSITTSSVLPPEQLLRLMRVGPEFLQTVVKSEKAASCLRFVSASEISPEEIRKYSALREKEQEKFAREFNQTLVSIFDADDE